MGNRLHTGAAMTWLRLHARGCAAIALFAMALQIFSTFGHVHPTDGSPLQATVKSVTVAKSHAAISSTAVAATDAATPASGGDGDPLCPLCLVWALVGTAQVPPVPALPMPIVYATFDPPRLIATIRSFDIPTSFWSRGPPTT